MSHFKVTTIPSAVLRLLLALASTTAIANAAQVAAGEKQPAIQAAPQNRNPSDRNDLGADLEKMRNLLALMQRNVAFVSTGDTPLKHQLELEIEMWQLLMRDMERKSRPADASSSSSAP